MPSNRLLVPIDGQCCTQGFCLGDRILQTSTGHSAWIHRVKRLGIKNSIVVLWIDGPKAGDKQMFIGQAVCNQFEFYEPRETDLSKADMRSYHRLSQDEINHINMMNNM